MKFIKTECGDYIRADAVIALTVDDDKIDRYDIVAWTGKGRYTVARDFADDEVDDFLDYLVTEYLSGEVVDVSAVREKFAAPQE